MGVGDLLKCAIFGTFLVPVSKTSELPKESAFYGIIDIFLSWKHFEKAYLMIMLPTEAQSMLRFLRVCKGLRTVCVTQILSPE